MTVDEHVYEHEVDNAYVVKILTDDYEGEQLADELRAFVGERLVTDDA